jgi:hypothetical protein
MRAGVVAIVGLALAGLVPGAAHAQTYPGVYTDSPLDQIQRSQRSQLEANRNVIATQGQNRVQQQLDLERQTLEESRREREGYLYQENTQQRGVETQLREDDLRLRQIDQSNRDRELKQYLEQQQQEAEARQQQGLK